MEYVNRRRKTGGISILYKDEKESEEKMLKR